MKILTRTATENPFDLALQKVRDYSALVKFRLTLTVVFSALMAFLIAETGKIDWLTAILLAVGGFSVTSAANALNQVLERDYDKLMKRTENRPVASGRMSVSEAVLAAGIMSLCGLVLLALIHPLASFLGVIALLSYAFLYTPLKRISSAAISVGAFAGALPMIIGCVASQGHITALALALFALQFFWQFPHFGAIGWLGFEDYQKAGFKFIATKNGRPDRNTGIQSLVYALFLIPIGLVPFFEGRTGVLSAAILVILSLLYAWFGLHLYRKESRKSALMLMFSSLVYIPVILVAFWLDKV